MLNRETSKDTFNNHCGRDKQPYELQFHIFMIVFETRLILIQSSLLLYSLLLYSLLKCQKQHACKVHSYKQITEVYEIYTKSTEKISQINCLFFDYLLHYTTTPLTSSVTRRH